MSRAEEEKPPVVAVPADLELEDRLVGPFTARQALIIGAGACGIYLAGSALRALVPLPVLIMAGVASIGLLLAVVTAQRDGLSLDRLTLLAAAFAVRPKRYAADPTGDGLDTSELASLAPTSAVLVEPGVLGLGADGAVALVECGTVNLGLFSGSEARMVLLSLGAVLNGISGPFQVAAVSHRIDLGAHAQRVELDAAALPRGALREAAVEHAEFLRCLTDGEMLYGRRVLLVLREPGPVSRSGPLLAARAAQAVQLLGACGLTARQLTAAEAAGAVAAACDPQRGPAASLLDLNDPPDLAEVE